MRLMAFAMVPLAIFGLLAAQPVVTLLFQYGKVDAGGVELTAQALAIFLVALPSESAIVLLARVFYAGRDTRTPVAAALLAVAVSVAVVGGRGRADGDCRDSRSASPSPPGSRRSCSWSCSSGGCPHSR